MANKKKKAIEAINAMRPRDSVFLDARLRHGGPMRHKAARRPQEQKRREVSLGW